MKLLFFVLFSLLVCIVLGKQQINDPDTKPLAKAIIKNSEPLQVFAKSTEKYTTADCSGSPYQVVVEGIWSPDQTIVGACFRAMDAWYKVKIGDVVIPSSDEVKKGVMQVDGKLQFLYAQWDIEESAPSDPMEPTIHNAVVVYTEEQLPEQENSEYWSFWSLNNIASAAVTAVKNGVAALSTNKELICKALPFNVKCREANDLVDAFTIPASSDHFQNDNNIDEWTRDDVYNWAIHTLKIDPAEASKLWLNHVCGDVLYALSESSLEKIFGSDRVGIVVKLRQAIKALHD